MKASGVILLALLLLVAETADSAAVILNLAGEWKLRLDPEDEGIGGNWPASPLESPDRITLPNTTDLAGFGFALNTNTMLHATSFPVTTRFPSVQEPTRADEHGYLVRRHLFVGAAWYEREVDIPETWRGRTVVLHLERAMWKTDAWIDGRRCDACDSLVAEHRHDLGTLSPGRHRLTVRVDNRMIQNLSTVTHAYGPETQSRWNGIVGKLTLEAAELVDIQSLRVFPAPDQRSVRVVFQVINQKADALPQKVQFQLFPEHVDVPLAEATVDLQCPVGGSAHETTLHLSSPAQAWDEFHPVRYRVSGSTGGQARTWVMFGFRQIRVRGTELLLNNRPIFLRGTLDCAVYPKTGHPPVHVAEWMRVLGTVKDYGFNHVRFHTWCPPEAAFEAADRLGLYLQPEAPAWVDDWGTRTVTHPAGIGRDPEVTEFLRTELRRMSEAYGNHPSFLLCAVGNEFGLQSTDWDVVNRLVAEIKVQDTRRLYTGCGARKHLAADDYWFTHNSGAGTRGVGPGHTDWDFAAAAAASPVPLIAHETGQRPVFPDYPRLLPKFTGPLLPLNLQRFADALRANGLADQGSDFVRASARFQLLQYKTEHEGMRRTRGYSGYQLLMLNDFTGQSEALVGILDPFWEGKGVVDAAAVRTWNTPTVVLARFPKYTWTSAETFTAKVQVSHFGAADLPAGAMQWRLEGQRQVVARGEFETARVPVGSVADLGTISAVLNDIREATALTLSLNFAGSSNQWKLWVYPALPPESAPPGILVTHELDNTARAALKAGGKVLLFAPGVKNAYAAGANFESVYWSAGWWGNKFSSLGLLCDPAHPALHDFPNDGCSDWQWRALCQGATVLDLTGAPAGFRPIVQAVPDFHYNTLLGQVFEVKTGGGFLLVCTYDLDGRISERPAAAQFRRSLFRYVASKDFNPSIEVPLPWIEARCGRAGLANHGATVLRATSEDRAHGNLTANLLDGDPATFWHSRWQPQPDSLPQELVIDLGREVAFRGITCLPRQDQSNGRIARADIFVASNAENWGAPVAELVGSNTKDLVTVLFPHPVTGRYLRLVVRAEVSGQSFASLAELEIITDAAKP